MEEELKGGNVAESVVRIGSTVRKPVVRASLNVEAYLAHLAEKNFANAPRSLGRDESGRQILEFIEGNTIDSPRSLGLADLEEIAKVIRELHAVSSDFPMDLRSDDWSVAVRPDTEELICHNDLAPWNIVRGETRWVFIDWDGSGPSSRLWDLAYAAQSFVPLAPGGDPRKDAVRLRAFADSYGLSEQERERFPPLMARRTRAGYELLAEGARTGVEPWSRIYSIDNGQYWREAAAYVESWKAVWLDALV